MLIICPKCFAKYTVNEKGFASETQIFQCSRCGKKFEEKVRFGDEKNVVSSSMASSDNQIGQQNTFDNGIEGQLNTESVDKKMDFTPRPSGVLPQEFMPVNEEPLSRTRKVVALLIMFFVFLAISCGAYIWMNRTKIVQTYPSVKLLFQSNELEQLRPVSTIEPKNQPINEIVPKPLEVAPVQVIEPELSPVTIDTQGGSDETVIQTVGVKDRILPVETPVNEVKSQIEKISEPIIKNIPTSNENVNDEQLNMVVSDSAEQEIILEEIPMPQEEKNDMAIEQSDSVIPVLPNTVEVKDVSFRYDQTDVSAPRLFVQGVVSNLTDRKILMPPLQVQLFDANNTVLGVRDLPYAPADLNPKAGEFFFYELMDVPEGIVAKIDIKIKGK